MVRTSSSHLHNIRGVEDVEVFVWFGEGCGGVLCGIRWFDEEFHTLELLFPGESTQCCQTQLTPHLEEDVGVFLDNWAL